MSDQPTSFHDFKWACGHTGPSYCKICRDDQVAKATVLAEDLEMQISALTAENERLVFELTAANGHCDELKEIVTKMQLRIEELEAENERLRAAYHTYRDASLSAYEPAK